MLIDFVLEPGDSLVGGGLALQHNGAPVRHDQPCPGQHNAILTEGNLAVVEADELGTLWDEQKPAGCAVTDVLGDLGRDLARKVRADAGYQRSRNNRAGLHELARRRVCEPLGAHGFAVDWTIEEGELAIRHVDDRVTPRRSSAQ
jgi:hypothetical protein